MRFSVLWRTDVMFRTITDAAPEKTQKARATVLGSLPPQSNSIELGSSDEEGSGTRLLPFRPF